MATPPFGLPPSWSRRVLQRPPPAPGPLGPCGVGPWSLSPKILRPPPLPPPLLLTGSLLGWRRTSGRLPLHWPPNRPSKHRPLAFGRPPQAASPPHDHHARTLSAAYGSPPISTTPLPSHPSIPTFPSSMRTSWSRRGATPCPRSAKGGRSCRSSEGTRPRPLRPLPFRR